MKAPSQVEAPTKHVGIWIRVSTEDQAKGDSPQHHEMRARQYAAAKGWEVVEVYDLAGTSGKSVIEQPECKRMLHDLERGHIQGLIFSKLARLARNTRELLDFADTFRTHQADFISLQESIDTSTPAGRLFYTVIAAMAQWEREETSDRVKASVPVRAKLGKPLGGAAPFGYQWKDRKLIPDLKEAPVRRLIYELYAEHRRKKAVARILNERGLRTRKGEKFSDTTIDRLIQDPTAKGIHRANYTRSVGQGKAWALKPEHEWVHVSVEPIVSEELWQRCNDLLETRKTKAARLGRRPVHLFSGLISCACGTKMYVGSGSPKYACAKCKNRIPAADVEGIFLDELKGYLLSPDKLAEYLSQANATISEKTQLLDTLRKELERVKAEADKAYDLYMANGLTIPQFKARFQPLDARKTQIEAEIPRLEAELDILKVNGLSSEEIMADAQNLHLRWPQMTLEERRNIVELLVTSIVAGKDEITLNLCYRPISQETTKRQRNNVPAGSMVIPSGNADVHQT